MKIETGFIQAKEGARIFYRYHIPERIKALLLLLHGYAEHSGRYEHVIGDLGGRGYAVFAPDHRGHGRSPGVPGDIESFSRILDDIRRLQFQARSYEPEAPLFLLGHSMGGLIALLYALNYQEEFSGLILSAATAKLPSYASPILVPMAGLLARFFPLLPAQKFEYREVSSDPEVIRRLEADAYYYKGKMRTRTGNEIIKGIKRLQGELGKLELPLLVLQGSEDVNMEPEASQLIYQGASSRDKTRKLFPGMRHEILNEPEKQKVLELIGEWIDQRVE